MRDKVNIIGGGLAGCEAAYQLSKRGVSVRLFDMKPAKKTDAHVSNDLCELVCSNSLRSDRLSNAVGLLKEEMRLLGSLIMKAADSSRVEAGGALAVDRLKFARFVTEILESDPNIEIISEEVTFFEKFGYEKVIVATGPLTSDALFESIEKTTGRDNLYFFDAAAPIVSFDSINMDRAFFASRYERGKDYINCPMSEQEYMDFHSELIRAETADIKDFEHNVFEGCMPIEEMALRGPMTMCFGPLKPKGIIDPRTGREPFANVQLRRENAEGTMFNIVGFQTHLRFPEQRRVFSMIPGLEDAEFLRYGVMHKNRFLRSPGILLNDYSLKENPDMFFAGQITGVEGYVESAASGLVAGIMCACSCLGENRPVFSARTAVGALAEYVSSYASSDFQPMNINYGIIEPLDKKIRNKELKNMEIASRSLEEIICLKEQQSVL